ACVERGPLRLEGGKDCKVLPILTVRVAAQLCKQVVCFLSHGIARYTMGLLSLSPPRYACGGTDGMWYVGGNGLARLVWLTTATSLGKAPAAPVVSPRGREGGEETMAIISQGVVV